MVLVQYYALKFASWQHPGMGCEQGLLCLTLLLIAD